MLKSSYPINQSRHAARLAPLIIAANMLATCCAIAQQPTAPSGTAPVSPTDVTGIWIDHTGRGAVEITTCGARLCGYIYWVQASLNPKGEPLLDHKNPDQKQRNKPICGTRVLINLAKQGAARVGNVWGDGSIYDPEEGETYNVEIKLNSANELNVFGYLGVKLLGESYTWKRATTNMTRCGPARA